MIAGLRRILLSVVLLSAAAMVLLLTDLHSRKGGGDPKGDGDAPVALLKHASSPFLDEMEDAALGALAERGYRDGAGITLRRFCADGDMPTSTTIARRITDGSFRLVVTISTLSLQAVANANTSSRTPHVFGGVTDPSGAGVGIASMDSTNKPPWMAGIGTFQPVEPIFRMARRFWPGLKVVGVVWNPAERNSEICVTKARAVCSGLGIQLLEATVDQTKDVRDAASALVSRGAQAFWTGFDITVYGATSSLCEIAARAGIPIFSNNTGHVRDGTLFDLGANYHQVGRQIGTIAADVLGGEDPALMPVRNFMPERLMLNRKVLTSLRDPWRFTDEAIRQAEMIVAADGSLEKEARKAAAGAGANRTWRMQELYYIESPLVEDSARGFRDGLREAGLLEGADFTLKTLSAQGDMTALGSLFDTARIAGVDMFIVFSTPTLQTAVKKSGNTPVVFTVVADPLLAGAGKSDEDHLPNITGVCTQGPYAEMAELLRTHFPAIRRVGTLFCPAESNSVANKDLFARAAAQCGLKVEAVAVNSAGELSDAAMALCGRSLDAVVQVIDNLTAAGFPAVARAANRARLPIFTFQDATIDAGATVVLSRDYYEAGKETAAMAVRVMRGEKPGEIPFAPPRTMRLLVNPDNAAAIGFRIPPALLEKAQKVVPAEGS